MPAARGATVNADVQLGLRMLSLGGQRIETKVTEEFFGFGRQPAVQAPAGSETYELPTSGLGALGAGALATGHTLAPATSPRQWV